MGASGNIEHTADDHASGLSTGMSVDGRNHICEANETNPSA